jgi:hypothetical protein
VPSRLRALLPGLRDSDLSASAVPAPSAGRLDLNLSGVWGPIPSLPPALGSVVYADVYGANAVLPLSRPEAMRVPAVERARHIIAGVVANVPLRAYRGGQVLEGADAPAWLTSTAGTVSAYHRLLWTADDLLFHGWSCWSRTNGVDGKPLQVDRIPMGSWSMDKVGRVYVADPLTGDHVLVDQRTVIAIPGPHEGILTADPGTIRHAADLQRAAATAARNPAAYMYLRQVQGSPLKLRSDDPEEVTVESTVADWTAARNSPNGGVAFVPLGLEVGQLGTFDTHLLTEGRNAAAVDVARIVSLPADMLDAAGPSSLTYATTRDNDQRAIQHGAGLYLSSISAALSLDSVTPRGTELRFDVQDWLESPVPDAAPARPTVSRETTPAPAPSAPAALEVVA